MARADRRFGSVRVMEPHRPMRSGPDDDRPDAPPTSQRRRRDALPLDEAWLEDEALRTLARADASRQRLIETVERKLAERCDRTGEDGAALDGLVPPVVDRLVERGYVDDRRLAAHLFERGRRAGRSRAWLRDQLRAKGIDEETLEAVERERSVAATGVDDPECGGFDHADEVEAAFRIARKKRLGPFCPDPQRRVAERQRHLGFLARRGFSSDVAHHVVDAELES